MMDFRDGRWSTTVSNANDCLSSIGLVEDTTVYPLRCDCGHDMPLRAPQAQPRVAASGEQQLLASTIAVDCKKKKPSKSKLTLPLNRDRRDSVGACSGRRDSGGGGGFSGCSNGGTGLRMMSAADERMIDEAIQLANQFANSSLQASDLDPDLTGRSKNKFLLMFPLKKTSPQIEKMTFTDGLAMKVTATAAQSLTPEAEEAYNELVTKGPSSEMGSDRLHSPSTQQSDAASEAEEESSPFRSPRSASSVVKKTVYRQSSSPGHMPSPHQPTENECKQRVPGRGRHILRKSLSAAGRSLSSPHRSLSSPHQTSLLPLPPSLVDMSTASCLEADDDDLSDMPSSPPPPIPLTQVPPLAYDSVGLYNNLDPFWRQEMRLDFEADEEITSMQGRYKSKSDNVSYEELLEFAPTAHDLERDVRVMQKVLGRELATDSACRSALRETRGDVLNAIKFIKLMQLRRLFLSSCFEAGPIADISRCKDALMLCNWDVRRAAEHVANCGR